MRNTKHLIILFALTLWLISGCSGAPPAATPTPTRTPEPTETPVPPTATATETPIPATETPTPEVIEVTPYPPDVNPLTGLQVEDETMLSHTPLAIKVSNSPAVRPQSGLATADIVYEHYAEGRVTRFTAVFYGEYPERVGSVRSGRLIDLEIPAMYQGLFAFSGMSGGVKERFRESDLFPDQVATPDFGIGQPYFYRISREGVAFVDALFADPMALRDLAQERGIDERPEFPKLMAFSETVPEGAVVDDTSYVEINYLPTVCTAQWTYDEATSRWARKTAGAMHTDYLTGEQLTAANVVLIFAHHVEDEIWEEMHGDQSNWKRSIQIQVWGSGSALVFRDGKMLQAYWEREARDHMLTFQDGAGHPLPLKPGNSWFQMIPLDVPAEEFEDGMYRFTP